MSSYAQVRKTKSIVRHDQDTLEGEMRDLSDRIDNLSQKVEANQSTLASGKKKHNVQKKTNIPRSCIPINIVISPKEDTVKQFISDQESIENLYKLYPEYKQLSSLLKTTERKQIAPVCRKLIAFCERFQGTNPHFSSEKLEIKIKLASALLDEICFGYFESKIEKSNVPSNFLFKISLDDPLFIECDALLQTLLLLAPQHPTLCRLQIRIAVYKARASRSAEILNKTIDSFEINLRDTSGVHSKFLRSYGMLFIERALLVGEVSDLHKAMPLLNPLQQAVALWRFSFKAKTNNAVFVKQSALVNWKKHLLKKFLKLWLPMSLRSPRKQIWN